MRAVGYVRISKADRDKSEADQRYSINAQREAIQRAALASGWELLTVHEDFSITGAHMRRGALQEALRCMEAGEADVLVIAKFDRLSRSARDWLNLLFDSNEQGWSIAVLNDQIDTSTATGWLHAALQAVFAEYERRLIGERTKAALDIVRRTKHVGRKSEVPAAVVAEIVALDAQGESASAIARHLTTEGRHNTKGRSKWHHSVVRAVLQREAVAS